MIKENIELIKTINTERIGNKIFSALRGRENINIKAICISYALQYIQQNKEANFNDYTTFIEEFNDNIEVLNILKENLKDCWDIVLNLENEFYTDELKAFILFSESNKRLLSEYETPTSIAELSYNILNIKDNETLLELCSGKGNFMVEVFKHMREINYIGIESDNMTRNISIIKASLISDDIKLVEEDTLYYNIDDKVDKVFSNYPFGVKMLFEDKKEISSKFDIVEDILRTASAEWVYNLKVIEAMNNNGKGVVVSTSGSTWNSRDEKIRKYFIENGFIEAIIYLPKLFHYTNIDTVLIVFSKNNKFIKMIDAREICIKGRINDILSDKNIKDIVTLFENKSLITEKAINKSVEELSKNEYNLNPIIYFEPAPKFENGVEFGSIIKSITRGIQIKAEDLDKIKSLEPTKIKLINLIDIGEGFINFTENTRYLKEIPKNIEKYRIKNNNIILSKIATNTFKSAVANIEENDYLFSSGNLFIIEVDENKVNPFFIQAFFQSETGELVFKTINTGGALNTIAIDKLKKMIIPLPSLEIQNKLANEYIEKTNKYKQLLENLKETKQEIRNIYK